RGGGPRRAAGQTPPAPMYQESPPGGTATRGLTPRPPVKPRVDPRASRNTGIDPVLHYRPKPDRLSNCTHGGSHWITGAAARVALQHCIEPGDESKADIRAPRLGATCHVRRSRFRTNKPARTTGRVG